MSNDDYGLVPSRRDARLLNALPNAILPQGSEGGDVVLLTIAIEDSNLTVRGLADYLVLADRVYGRFSPQGLKSYAQSTEGRLRISQVRHGSWEVWIEQAITNLPNATPYIVLWMFLRYLPSLSTALKDIAAAYQSLQEGRLANVKTRQLQDELEQNDSLVKLDDTQRRALARLLLETGDRESRLLHSASNFARKKVKSVRITMKKVNDSTEGDEQRSNS